MAVFRKIHVSFWGDVWVQNLEPEKKYFYLYLLTNERTRQCGIYEISKRQISYDTGYSIDTVSILLDYFISQDKIRFIEATNEIAIKNWLKYNENSSPKVKSLVNQELATVKEKSLIQYLYSIDTVPIHNRQKEEEKEEEEESNTTKGDGKFDDPENPPTDPKNKPAEEQKKIPGAPPMGTTLFEKSIQTNGNGEIRLSFLLDDTELSKNILELLNSGSESLLMACDLYMRPVEFQKFIIERFIREAVVKGEERSVGRLRLDFLWMCTNRMGELERAFQKDQQDLIWFEEELTKCTNGAPVEVVQTYRDFYLTPLDSGSHYYKTLANFSVEKTFKSWKSREYKTYRRIQQRAGPSGIPVKPRDGMTLEQLEALYLN